MKAIISKHFGTSQYSQQKLTGGHLNDVWKITVSRKEYVLKMQRLSRMYDLTANSHCWERLRSVLPVPKLIAFDTYRNRQYLLYKFVEGENGEKALKNENARVLADQIVRACRKANSLRWKGYGNFNPEGTGWNDSWQDYIFSWLEKQLVLGVRKHRWSPKLARQISDLFWQNYQRFANKKPQFMVADPLLSNFIFKDDVLVGVIDFDFGMSGDVLLQPAVWYNMYADGYLPYMGPLLMKRYGVKQSDIKTVKLLALFRAVSASASRTGDFVVFQRKRMRTILKELS